jgi:drug/metabolite transporter (DMT)-like permease
MKPRTAIKSFLAISFWGTSFVATKIVVQQVSPLAVIVLRFGLGWGVLMLVCLKRRQIVWIKGRDLPWLALLGLNGIAVHQLLQANGLVTTSATNSGWIVALTPIFAALLAWLLARESFGALKVIGLCVASVGTLLVISRGNLAGGLGGLLHVATVGDGLMLLSSPNWALFTVLSKRMMKTRYPPALMMMYVIGLGWLMVLPLFAAQRGWTQMPTLSVEGWISVIFLGLACSGLAYVFWYDALLAADASQVASFLYLEPIVTVVVAATWIGERVTWATLIGGGTILLGVWLVNRPAAMSGRSRPDI